MKPQTYFQLFNALWNIINCSIAGFLLYQVWKVIVAKKGKPEDKGGLYLAASLIFWVAAGLLDLFDWWVGEPKSADWALTYNLLRCWLSTWNSVFILLAIHYFDLVPRWFVDVVRHPDWKKWVRGIGVAVSVLTAFEAFRLWWSRAPAMAPFIPGTSFFHPDQRVTAHFDRAYFAARRFSPPGLDWWFPNSVHYERSVCGLAAGVVRGAGRRRMAEILESLFP